MLVQERQAGDISSGEPVQLVRVDRSKVYQYDICIYESIKTILLILMCEITLLMITIMGVCSIPEVYSIFFVIAWSVGLSYYGYREEIYKVEVFFLTLQLAMHLSMLLLSQLTGRRIFVVCGCFIIMVICSYVEYRQRWYSSTMMFLPVYFNAGVAYGLGVGPAWYCVIVFYLGGLACCRHIPCSNDEWERKTIFNKVQQCEMIYMGALLFLIAVTVTFWSVYWVWFSILPHMVFLGVYGTVWRHREYFMEKSLQPYTFRYGILYLLGIVFVKQTNRPERHAADDHPSPDHYQHPV